MELEFGDPCLLVRSGVHVESIRPPARGRHRDRRQGCSRPGRNLDMIISTPRVASFVALSRRLVSAF